MTLVETGRRTRPTTTYRLQLHRGFDFDDARAVLPFLAALGITDVYLSPIFTATAGSTHGYDVCRHTEINPELGGQAGFEAFAAEIVRLGMGMVLDFVPNHMSNDPGTNEWWRDVLESGPSSRFARYFDIDWDPVKPELKDRLLLPILGEQYGEALERGALVLRYADGALVLTYGSTELPVNPRPSARVFELGLPALKREIGADSAEMIELLSILTALRHLPVYTERDPGSQIERHREKEVARRRLAQLAAASPAVRAHIEQAVAVFNGTPGDASSFDRLHDLLEQQPYRLASWKTAADEINYRRFFDINTLAGLRVEDADVFDAIHSLLLTLVVSAPVTAVRLDHIDGLYDPRRYLLQLQAAIRQALSASRPAAGPIEDVATPALVVEKILSAGEPLRADWPVAGTTGYTFLNDVNGVFIDGRRAKKLQRLYTRLTGRQQSFADVRYESKHLIVSTALSSEFHVLVQAVNRISERDRRARDFTLASFRHAIREIVACFPVYRTYVADHGATAADAVMVDAAIAEARRRNPAMESSIFDFLRTVLLPDVHEDVAPEGPASGRRRWVGVAMRFQQYTAPVQAKGIEDTAFYRYHVLTSLNEVGGDPSRIGRTVAELHAANAERLAAWPGELLATTTHDTKRSEDARARINVVSELPDLWHAAVSKWRRVNAANRSRLPAGQAPDANDEYLFYQTLLAAWPMRRAADPVPREAPRDLVDRLAAYMQKAIREAKLHTSWITPNVEYEAAVARFIERALLGRTAAAFLASFVPLLDRVVTAGVVNSLAQLVLKATSPGVADFYQGTELWDLSLVDPDNRRPVDWRLRAQLLAELEPALAGADVDAAPAPQHTAHHDAIARLIETWPDGRIKLFVTATAARLRRSRPHLFTTGDYVPLAAGGRHADHVIAFARRHGGESIVIVVPRLTAALAGDALPVGPGVWQDTHVPLDGLGTTSTVFRDLVSDARVRVPAGEAVPQLSLGEILGVCPVAMLWAE